MTLNPITAWRNWRERRMLATLRDKNSWLHTWVAQGQESWSGEAVNAKTALTVSEYFGAIRAISEDIAKISLHVYRRLERGKLRLPNHPVQRLLDRPNPEMTAMAFRETLVQHAINWGRGIAEIVRTRAGQPAELWPLHPDRIEIKRDDNGQLLYLHWEDNRGDPVRLRDDQVFHLHGLGWDGTTGYSVATLARQAIGLSMAQVHAGAAFFRNGARPVGAIEHPGRFGGDNDEDLHRFLKVFRESYAGAGNTGKVMVLEDGMTFKGMTISNEDAQYIESRQFCVEDIARWLRIPPHKIGHLLRATFSNIEMQAIEYVTDTLLPWEVRIEQEIARKLINPPGSAIFAEHLNESLLRGDIKTRYEAYATGRQWGWLSANDILELENRNGIGEQGDIYLTPINMADAKTLLEPPEPEPDPFQRDEDEDDDSGDGESESGNNGEMTKRSSERLLVADRMREIVRENEFGGRLVNALSEAYQPVVESAYRRVIDVQVERIGRQSRRPGVKLEEWAAKWYGRQHEPILAVLEPVVTQFVGGAFVAVHGDALPDSLRVAGVELARTETRRHIDNSLAAIREHGSGVIEIWSSRARDEAADAIIEMRSLVEKVVGYAANTN